MFGWEILHDIKEGSFRPIKWKEHRIATLRLAQAYKRIGSNKYHRIIQCGSSLTFRRYGDNSLRLNSANFCKTRLCPTCCWRRSVRTFAQASKVMEAVADKYSFLFLTLTCKNVGASDLNKQIDRMYLAYKMLCLRKRFVDSVRGWCRSFEITFNWTTKEYHPHYHVILAVDNEYFNNNLYIEQGEWSSMWKSCLNVDYTPIVDVRRLKASEGGKGREIAEVAKYAVKPTSVMADLRGIASYDEHIKEEIIQFVNEISDTTIYVLDAALAHRRLIGYGGILKQMHKQLNLTDDEDLIHVSTDGEPVEYATFEIERYRWHTGYRNYLKLEDEPLEIEAIDEIEMTAPCG